jgi:hypothetical protein
MATFFGGTIATADFGVIDMWLTFSRSFFKLLLRACKNCIVSTKPPWPAEDCGRSGEETDLHDVCGCPALRRTPPSQAKSKGCSE